MHNRIHSLDYLKGIAMLMVIVGHILSFSLDLEQSPLMRLIIICEMPLFFVVSGYLSFKERNLDNVSEMVRRFFKRSVALLVPMMVWSVIVNIATDNVTPSITMLYRGGYWFFYTLWWCYLFMTVCDAVSRKLRCNYIAALIIFALPVITVFYLNLKDIEIEYFPIGQLTSFYPFYVIGYFVKKHMHAYKTLFNHWSYLPAILILLSVWIIPVSNHLLTVFLGYAGSLAAVILLWMFTKEIDARSGIGKALTIVGRNTLPIYAIHYLFIAPLPEVINSYLDVKLGLVLQLTVSMVYAVVIIVLCLAVDRIISYNRWSRLFFLGEFSKRELTV